MRKHIENKISNNLYELSLAHIEALSEMEQGGVLNNVLTGLENASYSLTIKEEDFKNRILRYTLTFVGYEQNIIKGYSLEDIEVFGKDRDEMTLAFSIFLEQEFLSVDRFDAYNTFQFSLQSALEKLNFFTYTQELLDKLEGANPVFILKSQKSAVFIPVINKVEAFKELFKRSNQRISKGKNDTVDYVYLFFNDQNKLTKIGTSKNPELREKTLQGQEPIIEMIAKWKAPKQIERELHKIFKEKRTRGEWFNLSTKDYIYVAQYMVHYELEI